MHHEIRTCLAAFLSLAALCAAPVAAERTCTSRHEYLGDHPSEVATPWALEAQGISHDDAHWYFSQNGARRNRSGRIWRMRVDRDLDYEADLDCPDQGAAYDTDGDGSPDTWCSQPISAVDFRGGPDLGALRYDHYGDIDVARGFVFVPFYRTGSPDPPAVVVFRADRTLAYVSHRLLPRPTDTDPPGRLHQEGGAAFAVIDPHGVLYVNRGSTDTIRRFRLDWDRLEGGGQLRFLEELPPLELVSRAGRPLPVKAIQGADFTPDGRLLYLSSGVANADGGITVFQVEDDSGGSCREESGACVGRAIERSANDRDAAFRYVYDPRHLWNLNQEPEGISVWNLDWRRPGEAPRRAAVHAIMLDNDALGDQVHVKHFAADIRCE